MAEKQGTVDEAKGEIESSFWDKFKHPVFGALLSAWIIINWKIFYLLICGRNDYQAVITLLETQVITWSNWLHLIVEPLASTTIYLFLAPSFKAWYFNHVKWVELKAERLSPIPRHEKTVVEEALKSENEERIALANAYNAMRSSADPEGKLLDLAKSVVTYKRQFDSAQRELILLKGDKAIKESEKLNALARENERLIAEVKSVRSIGNLVDGAISDFSSQYSSIVQQLAGVTSNPQGKPAQLLKVFFDKIVADLGKISATYKTRVIPEPNEVIP